MSRSPSSPPLHRADNVPAGLWPTVLGALLRGEDLTPSLAERVMDEIVTDAATPAQVAAFAVLLRAKGETPREVAGLVTSLMRHAVPVRIAGQAVDVVGTGGDGADTVNVSTMAALVVAGTGRQVVKHGARSSSSACGAADVLEELGVRIDLPAAGVAATVAACGIGFCFAPVFQPGLRHASGPRRQVGVPTVFNQLGPLINPAQPGASLVGCADARMAPVLARVFADRGHHALVVRGDDGLDELTVTTTSRIWVAAGGRVRLLELDPSGLGLVPAAPGALRGGDPAHNARVVREVLGGRTGPVRDAVVLNAAAAMLAHDGPGDVRTPAQLREALTRTLDAAARSIDSGAAETALREWVRTSNAVDAGT
jgi:anthranilate phosphoribosyltransferase